MSRETVRLTMAQALVRYLCNQFTEIGGQKVPLFAGVFGIFGHGNVTCLSEALEAVQDKLPTWRGQNEQSMALAAVGFAICYFSFVNIHGLAGIVARTLAFCLLYGTGVLFLKLTPDALPVWNTVKKRIGFRN